MVNIIPKDIRPAYHVPVEREAVHAKLLELLGIEAIPHSVDYTTAATREEDGILVTGVKYSNSLGETVPGILMVLEDSEGRLPGVVCISGTSGSAERVANRSFIGRNHERGR